MMVWCCVIASEIGAIMAFHRGMRLGWHFPAAGRGYARRPDLGEETVAATRNGFHEAGTLSRVAEGLADFVDDFVEPVVEIHEGISRPELFLQFLACHDLAGMLKQCRKYLEWLFLKPNPYTMFA